ncbi:hypothetical protein BTO01_23180 [Vibrio jasicida]|uniref:hypothetical protein n=1 Tax=Vibrio jasicida TaxID=766224 RepID=UPI000CF3A99B|nr:hypothetical protein [Vibrio jasicida]PQJ55400.1 hypothetical protein BTO01_23180 [Vibrio jasicida]
MKLSAIKAGDNVTWVVKSDYCDEFRVLDIYPHTTLRDEQGDPVKMALLTPVNVERFALTMMSGEVPDGAHIQVEAPLAMLLPVLTRSVH